MSKITNDGLTQSGAGCFIAVPTWQQWASKGYTTDERLATRSLRRHHFCSWEVTDRRAHRQTDRGTAL